MLCCVYQLLSQLGICFSTEGDFLKKPFALASLPESRDFSPYCRYRGVRQHINFPMDISAYPLGEAKEYIRRLARMGMNAITFHSYNGQWHPYHKGEERVPAGHFFYGQRHAVPADPELAASGGQPPDLLHPRGGGHPGGAGQAGAVRRVLAGPGDGHRQRGGPR